MLFGLTFGGRYKTIENKLKSLIDEITRLNAIKPDEFSKPTNDENSQQANELINIDNFIAKLESDIAKYNSKISEINQNILELDNFAKQINEFNVKYKNIKSNFKLIKEKFKLNDQDLIFDLKVNVQSIFTEINKLTCEKESLEKSTTLHNMIVPELSDKDIVDEQLKKAISLLDKKEILFKYKDKLKLQISDEEKKYQQYLESLKSWEIKIKELENGSDSVQGKSYYEKEKNYLNNKLDQELQGKYNTRLTYLKQIYNCKKEISIVNEDIYKPVKEKLDQILNKIDNQINFTVDIKIDDSFTNYFLSSINQVVKSPFKGKRDGFDVLQNEIRKHNFNNEDDVVKFVTNLYECLYKDDKNNYDKIDSLIINNRLDFYNYLFSIQYLNIDYTLRMNNKLLEQLSPGERGSVLLIFYLALDKSNCPLIIDQPEDNLDNQSVYLKLVPCIKNAKANRQVIIVTHNPNIAIACDAEEIIYCSIDKIKSEIRYISGSIESPKIRQHVLNVLEGTSPAFDLRKKKYFY